MAESLTNTHKVMGSSPAQPKSTYHYCMKGPKPAAHCRILRGRKEKKLVRNYDDLATPRVRNQSDPWCKYVMQPITRPLAATEGAIVPIRGQNLESQVTTKKVIEDKYFIVIQTNKFLNWLR